MEHTLTIERLRHLFDYDPETGHFVRRVQRGTRGKVGQIAGSFINNGRISIIVDYKKHQAHRLAWFYVHGEWPKGDIDHINGNPADNRLVNLRDVPHAINMQNQRRAQTRSKTGVLGVVQRGPKFLAVLRLDGRAKVVGRFDTIQEAHAAYVAAKRQLHPGCTI